MQKGQKVRAKKYGLYWEKVKNLKVLYWNWTGFVERLHEQEVGKPAVRAELVWKP